MSALRNVSGSQVRAQLSVRDVSGDLPTPERWKTWAPHGTGLIREEVGLPPNFFPRLGVG